MESCMLAKKYVPNKTDPTGWYLSEKLDGIRALWKPDIKKFISRNGKSFVAPSWFIKNLPNIPLDGELWLGRGRFNACSGIVRRKHDVDWDGIKYLLIDYVSESGIFAEHYETLLDLELPPWVYVIRQIKCEGSEHLREFQEMILSKGGEGIMLRNPNSHYEFRRSSNLLKVKKWKKAVAEVTGYQPGKGKHKGRLGALICAWHSEDPYGKTLCIELGTGFSDYERENPPAIGTEVYFKYFERGEEGAPRFPVFICVLNK